MSAERSPDASPLTVARVSLQGLRPRQEDAAAWASAGGSVLLVVADGMGGLEQGTFAARKACEAFLKTGVRFLLSGGDPAGWLQNAAAVANGALLQAQRTAGWSAVGTTVVAAFLSDDQLVVAHAGDSRVYLVTEDDVQTLTRDHAPAHELVVKGEALTLSQARRMVGCGISRCLGDEAFPGLEIQKVSLPRNRPVILVLTTDGAHEYLENNDFLHQAAGSVSTQDFAQRLANLALSRGSTDNITVLVAELGHFPRSRVAAVPVVAAKVARPRFRRWGLVILACLLGAAAGFLAGSLFPVKTLPAPNDAQLTVAPSRTAGPAGLGEKSHEHR